VVCVRISLVGSLLIVGDAVPNNTMIEVNA